VKGHALRLALASTLTAGAAAAAQAPASSARPAGGDVARLVAALQGETPMVGDLRALTDEIGGRPTGSDANRRSVEWALARFRDAGVSARAESFPMPRQWQERSARATVGGDSTFAVRVAAMPFSVATAPAGVTAPLVDGGRGTDSDFLRLGESVRGAFLLVETKELTDLAGLFREYAEASALERRALGAGAAGVVYMSSRPRGLLYRHTAALGHRNTAPLLIMEREGAARVLRLLRDGRKLTLNAVVDAQDGGAYESQNVVAEIRGRERPQEVVIVGAHLDSWDLGTGALDNGCNVAMLIDVARQIQRLGLRPRRTIRIALWNGEEQGMNGSWGYARDHASELDRHVMAASFDIGSGRITGFFTGGRGREITPTLEAALQGVADLGPYVHVDEPVVGTDNFDFMLEGVANLVAIQADATYGPDYHAASDTFDKVDLPQMRRNAAIAAAVLWGFAEADAPWGRQTPEQVRTLVETTTLKQQMESFGVYEDWRAGKRGRGVPR
jgi:carboxypeptidase Q